MNDPGLRFLIDVSAGGGIEKYLREKGYDTKAVRDIDPRMEDEDIIGIAVSEGRMVVTMDKDFGELVYRCSMRHSGILLLRLEDETGTEKLRVVIHIMENYSSQIKDCFCVFQNERLRIRKTGRRSMHVTGRAEPGASEVQRRIREIMHIIYTPQACEKICSFCIIQSMLGCKTGNKTSVTN